MFSCTQSWLSVKVHCASMSAARAGVALVRLNNAMSGLWPVNERPGRDWWNWLRANMITSVSFRIWWYQCCMLVRVINALAIECSLLPGSNTGKLLNPPQRHRRRSQQGEMDQSAMSAQSRSLSFCALLHPRSIWCVLLGQTVKWFY